jgi:4-aminobutyrate aminotransferase / (S)-3-amino-2-methylpropionate transaminase / 5-aminovalerate transaminase
MIKTKNRLIQENFDVEQYRDLTEKRKLIEDFSACYEIPLLWDKAKNFSIFDNLGNKWIDMTSGIFVANAGHANSWIKKAIQKCLKKDLLYSFCYNTEIRIEFIEYLLSISPSYFNKVVLMNSGSESVDVAYRLIKTWGKKRNKHTIISFGDSYHGRGLAGSLLSRNKKYSEWSGVEDKIYFLRGEKTFEEEIKSILNPETIAAFFIEAYRGWDVSFLSEKYMEDLVFYAKKNNILICIDEIQSGFYRVGKLYSYMRYGEYLRPDIICLGKGISSSLPLAAVLSNSDIIDIDKTMDLSGTHPGDPICLYAALANLKFLQEKDFQQNLEKKIELFKDVKKLEKYSIVEKVNVDGLVAAVVFHKKENADKVIYECINNGVLPVYTNRNSMKIGPPLTISITAIKEAFSVFEEVIIKYENNRI